jgi:sugar phosphate isomerase/epimerase
MKLPQVGAQLYTVREHLKNPRQFAQTIDRLKGIGYCAVELIHSDTISDQEIAKICDAAGVAVAAAHIREKSIFEQPESVAEKLKILGAKIGVYAFPSGVNLASAPEVEKFADGLEQSARYLNRYGLTLAYHNHALEFVRVGRQLVYGLSNAPPSHPTRSRTRVSGCICLLFIALFRSAYASSYPDPLCPPSTT